MQYLLYPIALYLLITGIRYFVTFLQLRKLTVQYALFQLQPANATPIYLKELFQNPIAELAQYGFKPCRYIQTRALTKVEPSIACELLLYHPSHKTYAIVRLRLLAESANLFDIDFYTFFQDKTLLTTINGRAYGIVGSVPQAIVQDPYSADTSVQWQMHQDRLAQLSTDKPPCGLAPDVFVKALQARFKTYVDQLVQIGILVSKSQPEEFQLNWRVVIRQTWKNVRFSGKVARLTAERRQQAKTDPTQQVEIPVEVELLSYQRMDFLQRDLVGRKFRTWMLLGSLALFLATYTQVFSPEKFAAFMGALLLHEGGHLLAMKLFGYQDTALLFLPFLGALATARKEDATLSQKFWISLAGPLPGLILGIVLLTISNHTVSHSDWMIEASWILIGLNLFNLLPIYPLDGGQIADLLVFSRHPYLGVTFKGVGVLLLGILGLAQPMMFVFAGLIAFSIPGSFRVAKVTAKLRQDLRLVQSADQETVLSLIFNQLKQLGHSHLPFAQRYGLAKNLLLSRHELRAKWTTRMALSLFYCLSLLGGIVGTLQAAAPNWANAVAYSRHNNEQLLERQNAELQRHLNEATAALAENPDDVEAYLKRARARAWFQDHQGALADYDQIVRLKPNDVPTLSQRAMYRFMHENAQGALQDYTLILSLDSKNVEAYQRRAQVLMTLKRYNNAIADYDAVIRLAPQDFWLYLDRGYARQASKDYKGAIADANTILQLQPNQPDAYTLRSEARRSLGDTQGAIADQQKADALYETWEE